ncbi:proton-conducting transporter transmembrane domain-containing protein [Salinisphaera hydrothermalis]|uniref:proton-conducting transporter transmembrane domain-containing protein n=1 Tax=Salinisphaera hydrothermalis TaxID=563188 RepID=UPI00333F919B
MAPDLPAVIGINGVAIAAVAWLVALVAGFIRGGRWLAKLWLLVGLVVLIVAVARALLAQTSISGSLPFNPLLAATPIHFDGAALWLLLFGALAAFGAVCSDSPVARGPSWYSGVAVSLLGALGVFGVQEGAAFLISWELMSLGGAMMLVSEQADRDSARGVLFMLGLLEVGSVALFAAILWLTAATGQSLFSGFALSGWPGFVVALLLLIGFGAKLGLLPFYEWYPGAYASGSGASGAILSGIILNAGYFALVRGLIDWCGHAHAGLAQVVLAVAVISAILAALYAFQQDDWRRLLAFSSADNAAIAVSLAGSAVLFRVHGQEQLAGMAWAAGLLHMAGHTLAKSGLLLAADNAFRAGRGYQLRQSGLARLMPWMTAGAFLAALSLAAVPPSPGFISEWFGFQSLFHGFSLDTLNARIALVLSGAGLALSGAIGVATFVKVVGLGMLGRQTETAPNRRQLGLNVIWLGLALLVLAIGMPWWLGALGQATSTRFGMTAAALMRHGWLLVPLSKDFAFISPTKLAIALIAYSAVPALIVLVLARLRPRRAPVWFGGLAEPADSATTALTFANALQRYYGFIYRPTVTSSSEHEISSYFPKRLIFSYFLAPLFGPAIFKPSVRSVSWLSLKLKGLQSGHLNFYLSLLGCVLVGILVIVLGVL